MPDPCTRLFLVTPPLAEAARARPGIEAALGAGDVACLLLRLAPGADGDAIAAGLAPAVQGRGVALLLEDPALARRAGADGVHASGGARALAAALAAFEPDGIVGAGGLASRDDAMRAGEAGADYLLFGEAGFAAEGPAPETVLDEAAWWAALFNVPCVALARALAEVEPLALAGAEFVALAGAAWDDPRGPAAAVADAQAALGRAARALEAAGAGA